MRWYAPTLDGEFVSEERRRSIRLARARKASETVLTFSLFAFFVITILLGASVGDPLLVEDLAACSTLAVALSALTYILLGLTGVRPERDRL